MVARNRRKKQASSINPARRRTRQGTIPFVKEITAADLTESKLSDKAVRLYLWLRSRASFSTGESYVGYQKMADANHWSYNTARRAYSELVEANLIIAKEQEGRGQRMTQVVMDRETIRSHLIARSLLGPEQGGVPTSGDGVPTSGESDLGGCPPVGRGVPTCGHGGVPTSGHLSESTRSESTRSESTFADPLRGPAEGAQDDTVRQGSQRTEAVASPGKVSETERSEVERQGPPHDASRHSGKESDDERSEEERKQRPVDSALDDLEKQRDQDRHEKAPGAVRVRLKQRAPTSASFRPPGGLTPGAGVEATTRSTPPPETPAEVVGVLKAEIRAAGLPSAGLPEGVNHAWRQQGKKLLASGYSPTQIRDMIRVLVWDWVAAREMVAKWSGDPIRQMPYPDMNAVWRYRDQAAARIETGFVISASDNRDQRGRGSAYLDRYRAEERKAKRNKINPFTKKRRG